jgi:hypothetical protein
MFFLPYDTFFLAGHSGRAWSDLSAGAGLDQHAHDVTFFHDQVLDAVDLDFGAWPFAEQHAVASLQIDRNKLTGLVAPSRSNRDDLALLRLLLGCIRDDDASGGLLLGFDALDDHPIVKRTEFHCSSPKPSNWNLWRNRSRRLG